MKAFFVLNWIDDTAEAKPAWYVMRRDTDARGGEREAYMCKCLRWRVRPGVEVLNTPNRGEVQVNAQYIIFDTAQPGVIEFRNDTCTVVPFEYPEAA